MEIIFLSRKKIGADLIDSSHLFANRKCIQNQMLKMVQNFFGGKNKKMFWNLLPEPEQCYFQAKIYCF